MKRNVLGNSDSRSIEEHCTFMPDDFYMRRVSHFAQLPIDNNDVIMLGDSLINGCEWHELIRNKHIKNRGINGDTIAGVRYRAATTMQGLPRKVFVMIGINDVSHNIAADDIANNIVALVDYLHTLSPATRIYLHSLLPFDSSYYYTSLEGKEQDVVTINRILHDAADSHNYTYIELYKHFVRPQTNLLDAAYTTDGLHLNGQGYNLWAQLLQPYINE